MTPPPAKTHAHTEWMNCEEIASIFCANALLLALSCAQKAGKRKIGAVNVKMADRMHAPVQALTKDNGDLE